MPSKSILKKTAKSPVNDAVANDAVANDAVAEDIKVDETNIVLDDEFVSTAKDVDDVFETKKLQIKKKEPIGVSTSISKPALKIIKKKVSITEESIMKDETTLPKEKATDKKAEKEAEKEKEHEVLVDVSKALKVSKKPSKKQDITELFNDDDVDYRYIITNYDFSKNKTLPKITKYEKALLVGKRAKQIEEGANANVKVLPGQTSIDIAEEELRQRKIPFIIKRPVGNKFEYWKPIDMEVIMD